MTVEGDALASEGEQVRPGFDGYFMGLAYAARERANCRGKKVGAVLVLNERVVSTGYNGTPQGMTNCDEGGCIRCERREQERAGGFGSGRGYDICICVHAEQNALLAAARHGIPVDGAIVYSTLQPCFGCLKEMVQAGVVGVRYRHAWSYPDADESLAQQYDALEQRFPDGAKQLTTPDPRQQWALGGSAPTDTGHPIESQVFNGDQP